MSDLNMPSEPDGIGGDEPPPETEEREPAPDEEPGGLGRTPPPPD